MSVDQMNMDFSLIIGVTGLILTIVGFFVAKRIISNRSEIRIKGSDNSLFQQQGEKNIAIGKQINIHPSNKREEHYSSTVVAESGSSSLFDKHHYCSCCKRGFKYFSTSEPSPFTLEPNTVTCPKCWNIDAV